jgi:hypothetical protein
VIPAALLKTGDCCLYTGKGLYGRIIRFHTGHTIGHVEVYLGNGLSSASRNGVGVGLYPYRSDDLAYVWRPKPFFSGPKALNYTVRNKGVPYGWLDLLAFGGFNVDGPGIVCSPWATNVYRDQPFDPFNGEPSKLIAPKDFLLSDVGDIYEVNNASLTRKSVDLAA